MGKKKIDGYVCERCGHIWLPRKNSIWEPKVCPDCHSPYWDRPRLNKKIKNKKGGR